MKACCNGCSAPSRRQALDGGDFGAVLHHRERQAGIDPPPVHQHRAGAALAVVAALLGSGQIEMVAQRVEQGRPRRHLELPLDAVDDQRNRNFVRNLDRLVGGSFACQCHMHLRMSSAPRQPIWAAAMDIASRLLARLKRIERHLPNNVHFISPDAGRVEPRHRPIPIMPRMRATSVGDTSAVAATSRCSLSPDSGLNSECDWSISASNCGSRMVSS